MQCITAAAAVDATGVTLTGGDELRRHHYRVILATPSYSTLVPQLHQTDDNGQLLGYNNADEAVLLDNCAV